MQLKVIREGKKLSQAAVAAKAGVSREHLSRLEAGRYDPTIGTLERVARALGVSLTTLLRRAGS